MTDLEDYHKNPTKEGLHLICSHLMALLSIYRYRYVYIIYKPTYRLMNSEINERNVIAGISFAAMILVLVAGFIGASLIPAYGQTAGIHEDQFIVCNFEAKCVIINTDDYMTKQASNDLWISFNNDLDTFDMEDLHD